MMEFEFKHIKKVLVANRGEIAIRCIKACAKVGLNSVSIYTESDATSSHASLANENVLLSGQNAGGYLDVSVQNPIFLPGYMSFRVYADPGIPG